MKFVRSTVADGGGSASENLPLPRSPGKRSIVANSRSSANAGWAYQLLESSQLQGLLSTALALAAKLIPRRKADGSSMGMALLPEIISTISAFQGAFDSVPQMLMDPDMQLRQAAREFACTHAGCTLATAEFYLHSCGNKAQADAEFERTGGAPAPPGFRPPCDDTWLAGIVDALSGECCVDIRYRGTFFVLLV